jgi:multidrug efflux pump subunit AcrA (membrane-fusion protein)
MLKSRFAKLGAAGFAAAAAVILIASSVGAHHGTAPSTLSSFNGLTGTAELAETTADQDAAADAAALAADTQAEAAEALAEQQKAAAEAAAEAAEDAADTETGDTETETETETGDTETGVASGDDHETGAPTGTKTAPKTDD